MNIIRGRNVHALLPVAIQALNDAGVRVDTRNGPALQVDSPVATVYERPTERVMLWPERDCNPFFHFYEQLWMLGGRNDVASVAYFADNMKNFSDDGQHFWGAYGYRWRHGMAGEPANWKKTDQLSLIIQLLRRNPNDRRCVLQMWDNTDLGHDGKDVPCNTTATFQRNPSNGALNLVVFCRSNDVIWGCYGANAVHFAALLEYVASFAGMDVGTYTQVSVNWHGYDKTFQPVAKKLWETANREQPDTGDLSPLFSFMNPYEDTIASYPMVAKGVTQEEWDNDLYQLLATGGRAPIRDRWNDPFFRDVAVPILRAHDIYRESKEVVRFERAMNALRFCKAIDWRTACHQWLDRRWRKAVEI